MLTLNLAGVCSGKHRIWPNNFHRDIFITWPVGLLEYLAYMAEFGTFGGHLKSNSDRSCDLWKASMLSSSVLCLYCPFKQIALQLESMAEICIPSHYKLTN